VATGAPSADDATADDPAGALTPAYRLRRVPALDGIRAVAAVVVVLFHARIGFADGGIGVDMFFVLSGFLITSILLPSALQGAVRFKTFYVRRGLRLLPAYFTVLLAALAASLVWDVPALRGAFFSFFYVSNWAVAAGQGLGLLHHTWSLAIEEQFYLLWPLTLVLLVRWAHAQCQRLLAGVAVALVLSYLTAVAGWALGLSPDLVWNSTLARGSQLLLGCLLAVAVGLYGLPRPSLGRAQGIVGGVALVALVVLANHTVADVWVHILLLWPVVAGLTALVIVGCLAPGRSPLSRVLTARPVVAVGKVSYGLYLWHYPILNVVDHELGLDGWGAKLLGLTLTAVVVPLSYRYVEQPFLRMKDLRFARR
jgi:peptidoglycan/LPS O-acetylase OafA/YrhL